MSVPIRIKPSRRVVIASGALALLVCALLLVQVTLGVRSAGRTVGVVFSDRHDEIRLRQVTPGLPAARAGLEAGDLIVAINGYATISPTDYDSAAAGFRRSVGQTLTVERDGVTVDLEIVPGVEFDWPAWLASAVATLLHLALALLVMGRLASDIRARLAWVLFLAVAVELALPINSLGSPALGVAVGSLFWLLTGLQFSVELHLASVIPEPAPWFRGRRWLVAVYYSVGLGVGVFLALSWLPALEGLPVFAWPWTDAGSVAMRIWFLVWVFGVVALLTNTAMRWPSGNGRYQALLVLLGVLPWAALTVAITKWDVEGAALPSWIEVGQPLILALYPIAVFLAISRYRLFSIELVVRRSLIYTALSTALLLVFYATLGAGGALMSVLLEGRSYAIWIIALATLVLGLVFSPLRRWFEKNIERRFFPERAAMRERLGRLVRELPHRGNLEGMSTALVSGVAEIFACRTVTLLLAEGESDLLVSRASYNGSAGAEALMANKQDPFMRRLAEHGRALPESRWPWGMTLGSWLRDLKFELIVPVVLDNELTGSLLLGEKNDGGDFRAEERELLDLLGSHVATVLENARLFESATIDALTGLQRREVVLAELDREIERAARYNRPLTIGMADLDNFKAINDQHGHQVGDIMLRQAAQTISGSLRSTDIVGRFGGEEFLILLPESDLVAAVRVVEKLRAAVERLTIETDSGNGISTTVSIGLASMSNMPEGLIPTPEALIAIADRSLYKAKREGRNRVAVAG